MINQTENSTITNTNRPLLVGLLIFVLLFAGIGGWLSVANLSGAVVSQGIVVVSGKPKTVQHLDGGIIDAILVGDGISVIKDDILISLDDKLLRINLEVSSNKLRENTAKRARLIAERDGRKLIIWKDKILELLSLKSDISIKIGQKKLFEARVLSRDGQVLQLKEQIAQYENRIVGTKAQLASLESQLGYMIEELTGIRSLKSKGLISNTQLMDRERQREQISGQIAAAQSENASFKNLIHEKQIQISQVELDFRQLVLEELGVVEREINDVVQQIHALLEQLKRVHIRAPVSGRIHDLQVFTIGGVISPGNQILQVIPENDVPEVEVKIEPQFIDELTIGQVATLRFTSFNQKTTPELIGNIKTISANSIVDLQSNASFFKVIVSIEVDQLVLLNDKSLVPGMPVEAFIKTRERTALSYLMKPLLDQVKHAFREE